MVELEMTLAEYQAVAAIAVLDAAARRVLAAGRMPDDDLVIIEAPRAWLEHLVEFVAAESSRTTPPARRSGRSTTPCSTGPRADLCCNIS